MTYTDAKTAFDAMNAEQQASVSRLFDLIRCRHFVPNVRDAFISAVEDEMRAIEIEMLLKHPVEGTA